MLEVCPDRMWSVPGFFAAPHVQLSKGPPDALRFSPRKTVNSRPLAISSAPHRSAHSRPDFKEAAERKGCHATLRRCLTYWTLNSWTPEEMPFLNHRMKITTPVVVPVIPRSFARAQRHFSIPIADAFHDVEFFASRNMFFIEHDLQGADLTFMACRLSVVR